MDGKTPAQIAYEAYAEHRAWQYYQGNPLPPWDGVRPDIQAAWEAAASAIYATIYPPNI